MQCELFSRDVDQCQGRGCVYRNGKCQRQAISPQARKPPPLGYYSVLRNGRGFSINAQDAERRLSQLDWFDLSRQEERNPTVAGELCDDTGRCYRVLGSAFTAAGWDGAVVTSNSATRTSSRSPLFARQNTRAFSPYVARRTVNVE